MSAELELMQSIKAKWGDSISAACGGAAPTAQAALQTFLAALIANETGGNADAKRFEPAVHLALWEVLLGRKAAYGSIGGRDLILFVAGLSQTPVNAPQSLRTDAFQRLDALATSWGLTQIMGYHCFDPQIYLGVPADRMDWISGLKDGAKSLVVTVRMLAQFAQRFHLDLARDDEALFRCWNSGQPNGQTHDPLYVSNGLARMAIWTSL